MSYPEYVARVAAGNLDPLTVVKTGRGLTR